MLSVEVSNIVQSISRVDISVRVYAKYQRSDEKLIAKLARMYGGF